MFVSVRLSMAEVSHTGVSEVVQPVQNDLLPDFSADEMSDAAERLNQKHMCFIGFSSRTNLRGPEKQTL